MTLEPLLNASPAIQIHTPRRCQRARARDWCSLPRPKGTLPHRTVGWAWVALMTIVCISAFFINELRTWGTWGPIHPLAVFTLVMLPLAVLACAPASGREPQTAMTKLFLGALVIAGIFTLWPGRIMHEGRDPELMPAIVGMLRSWQALPWPRLATVLLRALKAHGAREIFGIPGDFVLPFYKAIEQSRILPHFELSHEPAVGFAADAAARFHGGIGVAVVTYGAGAFNVVNAVAGAYAERSPVVVIAGAPGALERQSGLLLHHQARDGGHPARGVSRDHLRPGGADRSRRPRRPRSRACCTMRANAPCRSISKSRATWWTSNARRCGRWSVRAVDTDALAECVDEIMSRLRAAKRPVLVVDVEIRRYGIESRVVELARKLGLPAVTTFMGRGLLADAPDIVAGTYLGLAGDKTVTALVEESDAALLLGVILCDTNFALSSRHARSAPHHARHRPPGSHRSSHLCRPAARRAGRRADRTRGLRKAEAPKLKAPKPRLSARPEGRRHGDCAVRHRLRDQRPVRPPRSDADDRGYGRLPVHRDGDREHRARRARLLRRHGVRRAGRVSASRRRPGSVR